MPKNKKRGGMPRRSTPSNTDQRHMQGVDEKHFKLNDIVTISNTNVGIATGVQYLVLVSLDLNGFSWRVTNTQSGSLISEDTAFYGNRNGQFRKWAEIYQEYRVARVSCTLNLPQGGGIYSFSPVVRGIDPTGQSLGATPVLTPAEVTPAFSNLKMVHVTDPYKTHTLSYDYANWLMGTQSRAWRKSITSGPSNNREPYATTASTTPSPEQPFVSPGLVFAYTVTAAQSVNGGGFGIFECTTHYCYAQRRANPTQFRTYSVFRDGFLYTIPKGYVLSITGQEDAEEEVLSTHIMAAKSGHAITSVPQICDLTKSEMSDFAQIVGQRRAKAI